MFFLHCSILHCDILLFLLKIMKCGHFSTKCPPNHFLTPSFPKKLVRTGEPSLWSENTACLLVCKWWQTRVSSDTLMVYPHGQVWSPALLYLWKPNSAFILKVPSSVVPPALVSLEEKGRTRAFPRSLTQLLFQTPKKWYFTWNNTQKQCRKCRGKGKLYCCSLTNTFN